MSWIFCNHSVSEVHTKHLSYPVILLEPFCFQDSIGNFFVSFDSFWFIVFPMRLRKLFRILTSFVFLPYPNSLEFFVYWNFFGLLRFFFILCTFFVWRLESYHIEITASDTEFCFHDMDCHVFYWLKEKLNAIKFSVVRTSLSFVLFGVNLYFSGGLYLPFWLTSLQSYFLLCLCFSFLLISLLYLTKKKKSSIIFKK